MKIKLQPGEQELRDFYDSIEFSGDPAVLPEDDDPDGDPEVSESLIEKMLDFVQNRQVPHGRRRRS
jgi:hypothetical protein